MVDTSDKAIGARLKQALESRRETQAALAEVTGVSPQAVGLWLKTGEIERKNLIAACKWLGVSLDWVLAGDGAMEPGVAEPAGVYAGGARMARRDTPLISWVQAGEWQEAIDMFRPGDGEKMVHTFKRVGPNAYALRVNGDSMENPAGRPTYPDGCIIVVDPDREPTNGSKIVVRLENSKEATFKQLVIQGGERYLKPLNPRYPIAPMPADAEICGVVVDTQMDQD